MHTFTESEETLKSRGQYSILRAVHEEEKVRLREKFTIVQSYLNDALKAATANEPNHETIQATLSGIRFHLNEAADITIELESLAKQRQDLRLVLWPKV